MLRIRGKIGAWPVDLTLEMDEQDWARLGAQITTTTATASAPNVPNVAHDDALWNTVQALVRDAGQLPGPELLDRLQGLAGSTAAAKRLLVRLRHSANIQVTSGTDVPLYSWVAAAQ